jgi:hypothetical protein
MEQVLHSISGNCINDLLLDRKGDEWSGTPTGPREQRCATTLHLVCGPSASCLQVAIQQLGTYGRMFCGLKALLAQRSFEGGSGSSIAGVVKDTWNLRETAQSLNHCGWE